MKNRPLDHISPLDIITIALATLKLAGLTDASWIVCLLPFAIGIVVEVIADRMG